MDIQDNYKLSDRLIRALRNRRRSVSSTSIDAIEELVSQGADVNRQRDGTVPLHIACRNNDIYCLKFLLQKGARVNEVDGSGHTALHCVTKNVKFCKEIFDVLIQHGAFIDAVDKYNRTPIFLAASYNNAKCLKLLLQHGGDVNESDNFDRTPSLLAVDRNNAECLKLLLQHGSDTNLFDQRKTTPLYSAVYNNRIECLRILLEHGADANPFFQTIDPPVFCAIQLFNTECVELLLKHGADANIGNLGSKKTPLHLAVDYGDIKCTKLLLKHGADANLCEERNKRTPLHLAVCSNDIDCLNLMLQHGANVNVVDGDESTPLHLAVDYNQVECLKLLLQHGADVKTALHLAVKRNNIKCLKVLLQYGADISFRDLNEETPLMRAAAILAGETNTEHNAACLELLLRASGQFDLRNKKGELIPSIAHDKKLSEMLLPYCVNPRSLQVLCRHQIRSSLGDQFLPDIIPLLELPKVLQEFMLLQR